jgi:hypothetical protein
MVLFTTDTYCPLLSRGPSGVVMLVEGSTQVASHYSIAADVYIISEMYSGAQVAVPAGG